MLDLKPSVTSSFDPKAFGTGLAVALGRDEELEQDYTKKLQSMAKWMPNDDA